ncbi:UNVERIFIED_CONTAM: hypothetical protein GTU68_039687 [Idotea baltica]|nr:hypothetical protein [Idotea baltica]
MHKYDSSDLYLTVGRPPSFKIDGEVKSAGKQVVDEETMEKLWRSVTTDKQAEEFEIKKELNLAICYDDIEGRYRFNMYRQKNSPAMVIRKIETEIKSLEDLKLPDTLAELVMQKRGLVVVVGATGSGKSTTLAAMIDYRNRNEAGHIITIEDPVEFIHEHKKCVVSQREVGLDTDSFHSALKNTLRQAPTTILIGEIRDEETMEHALSFAETGHLCLATLHSNNANQAIERMMNFFPIEKHRQLYLNLSLNLKGIISQRLIKTVDGGRAAAIEILTSSSRVSELIKNGKTDEIKEAMEKGKSNGMQTFDQALISLVKEGRISEEEAVSNADSPTNLQLQIKLEQGSKEFI